MFLKVCLICEKKLNLKQIKDFWLRNSANRTAPRYRKSFLETWLTFHLCCKDARPPVGSAHPRWRFSCRTSVFAIAMNHHIDLTFFTTDIKLSSDLCGFRLWWTLSKCLNSPYIHHPASQYGALVLQPQSKYKTETPTERSCTNRALAVPALKANCIFVYPSLLLGKEPVKIEIISTVPASQADIVKHLRAG